MSNLVPVVRPDVNGKLVTRHVKVEASSADTSRSLPSPSVASTVPVISHETNVKIVWAAVDSALDTGAFEGTAVSSAEELRKALDTLDSGTIDAFRSAIDDESHVGFEDLLLSILHNKLHSESAGYLLFIAQQHSHEGLDNYWEDDLEGTIEYDNAMLTLRGLHQFGLEARHPIPKNILNAEAHERNDVSALVRLIQQGHKYDVDGIIKDWGADSFVIADVELGNFALEYPDEIDNAIKILNHNEGLDGMKLRAAYALGEEYDTPVDRIVDIIRERQTADMETLRLVLDAEAQPLSNGTL